MADLFVSSLLDALVDTAKLAPLLFVVYIAIEYVELRFGNRLGHAIERAGAAGPAIGALAGSVPQCGFSVMASALYSQRLVTIGTLIAVYLSTSDEAVPMILAEPESIGVLVPLLLTKIVIAIVAGYAIDFFFRKANKATLAHIEAVDEGHDDAGHHHEHVLDEEACCGHKPGAEAGKLSAKALLWHPFIHTLKILAFILAVTLAINLVIGAMGEDALATALAGHAALQPVFAALVGLIPNCAASVAITQLFLDGVISYSAVIAGLCASGGLGILVLFREDERKGEAIGIVALLFAISVVAGFIAGAVVPV